MPNGEPVLGRVFWSARAGQFYQEGRVGAVPRLEALEHLTEIRTVRGPRLMDELGRFVPSIGDLIPKSFSTQFIEKAREGSLTTRDVYRVRSPQDTYWQTISTYVDEAGKVHIQIQKFSRHTPVDRELEDAKIARQIAKDLNIKEGTKTTDQLLRLIRAKFHFLVR